MTKAEMKAMMASVQEAAAKAAESVMMKLVTTEAAPKAAPTDDVKAKRLAGLEKARAAKAAKAAAKPEPKAKAKAKAFEHDANAVNNSRKSVEVKGNGESLTVHFCEGKSKYLVLVGGGERLYVRSPAAIKAFAWVLRDGAGLQAVMDAANGWLVA